MADTPVVIPDLLKFKMTTDFDKLRREFGDAIASLANYRRSMAWEYVTKLEKHIALLQKELAMTEHQVAQLIEGERQLQDKIASMKITDDDLQTLANADESEAMKNYD